MSGDLTGTAEPGGELVEQKQAAGAAEALIDDRGELRFDDEGRPVETGENIEGEREGRAEFVKLLEQLLEVAFGLVARRRGPAWELGDGEAAAIAEPLVDVLDKYDLTPETCEGRLAFAVVSVIGPKLIAERAAQAREVEPERPVDAEEL